MNEITVRETAKLLGVSKQTVLGYLHRSPTIYPRLIGRQLENGMWLVDAFSAKQFVRPRRGNPNFRRRVHRLG